MAQRVTPEVEGRKFRTIGISSKELELYSTCHLFDICTVPVCRAQGMSVSIQILTCSGLSTIFWMKSQ